MADTPAAAESPVDLLGRTIADFKVLRKIGQGGMGQVYLARQLSLKREVALKILKKELAENDVALKRFQLEAEAVAKISHPNIVQVYVVGVQDGLHFMALEYVEGRNLREYLERKGPPEFAVALAILRQVAAALQRAGELGLVHRDIKPENILLNRKVEVKVADFGLSCYFAGDAKPLSLTQSGMTLGTPLYMSPEQVQGKPVDHRSDLYSFGVTCYHLLAGQPPYTGLNAFDVAVQHVHGTPEPLEQFRLDLPADLGVLVRKLMEKRPEDRYQSAKDVLRDLGKIQKGLSLGIEPNPATGTALNLNASHTNRGVGNSTASGFVPVFQAASRWPRRWIGLVGVLVCGVVGWWAFGQTHSVAGPALAPTTIGLPDVRPPIPLVTSREVELREKFRQRPVDVQVGMELGLLCIQERRFEEAEALFIELEGVKSTSSPNLFLAVGKFGKGIICAQRDQPTESNKLFEDAVLAVKPLSTNRVIIERFFFDHSEFGLAISEALNRNAENLSASNAKLPSTIDWMRTPAGLLRIKGSK